MVILVIGGLFLLVGGGELLVRGAVGLAAGFGVPPLVIGLTIVAFGTSAPELVVSLQASLGGHPDIVMGNVVGSNIANVLLIVGAAALFKPISVGAGLVRRDGSILMVATLGFIGLAMIGSIGRVSGIVMIIALVAYTVWSFWAARRRSPRGSNADGGDGGEELDMAPSGILIALVVTVLGIVGVIIGARLLIDGAVEIARLAGLSEAVIGLTLIAFGTSLPELATASMAAYRGHSDLALGNALGSNLFNMLAIAGVTATVIPIPVPEQILHFDLWVMLGVTAALMVMMTTDRRVSRIEGGVLLAGYCLYIAVVIGGVIG
jgi:cation:H+ antiporter